MHWEDQGALHNERYTVVPRTLIFVTIERHLLLLRGSAHKRIWPGRLNGLGGHLESGEHPLEGALRELREEAGLDLPSLQLRGLIHVAGRQPDPGVLLFIFTGQALSEFVRPSREGALEWHPLDALPYEQMVPDLPHLLPLLVGPQRTAAFIYGHYALDADGEMHYRYQSG